MVPEHIRRKQHRRRWIAFVSAYWVVVVATLLVGLDMLIASDEPASTKWMIGLTGGLIAALLVHWGALQTVALRQS